MPHVNVSCGIAFTFVRRADGSVDIHIKPEYVVPVLGPEAVIGTVYVNDIQVYPLPYGVENER